MYDNAYIKYLEKVSSLRKIYNQTKTEDGEYYNSDDEGEELCFKQYPMVYHNNLNNSFSYKNYSNCEPEGIVDYCTCKKTPCSLARSRKYYSPEKSYSPKKYYSPTTHCYPKNIKYYKYCKYQKKKAYTLGYVKPCPKIVVINKYLGKKCRYK